MARLEDGACAQESDAADDLSRDAAGIGHRAVRLDPAARHGDRQLGQQRRADADLDVGAQPGRLAAGLAVESDDPAEQGGEAEPDEGVQPVRAENREVHVSR